jgi:hypothetical protein
MDVFGSQKLGRIELVLPPKDTLIEGDRRAWNGRSIVGKVGGLEGLIIEGARGSVEGRCVCGWVQWDELVVFAAPILTNIDLCHS